MQDLFLLFFLIMLISSCCMFAILQVMRKTNYYASLTFLSEEMLLAVAPLTASVLVSTDSFHISTCVASSPQQFVFQLNSYKQ
jgi:hypothetical protein